MCAPVTSSLDWDAMAVESLGRRVRLELDAGNFEYARHYARLRYAARLRMRVSRSAPKDAVTYV